MEKLVAYINYVGDSVTQTSWKTNSGYANMPGYALPFPDPSWKTMTASVSAGQSKYNSKCAGCHSKDGPGMGELRTGEGRPRVPALWGSRSYTLGAAFHQVPQLAGIIKNHMPFGDEGSLTAQEALNLAAFINSQSRPVGYSATFFCANDPTTGAPNTLLKPATWWSGCNHPEEPFTNAQRISGPWAPIEAWRAQKFQEWQASQGN